MVPPVPYQPKFTKCQLDLLRRGQYAKVTEQIIAQTGAAHLRLSMDRLELICRRLGPEINSLSFLDLGCANGFFTNIFKYLGSPRCIGIDNNSHNTVLKVDSVNCLESARMQAGEFGVVVEYYDADIRQLIKADHPDLSADVVLLMSVFHHLFGGYGFNPENEERLGERGSAVLSWVSRHARSYLIFEMHEGIYADWNRQTIPVNLQRFTDYTRFEQLGVCQSYEPGGRSLWLCSRD